MEIAKFAILSISLLLLPAAGAIVTNFIEFEQNILDLVDTNHTEALQFVNPGFA